MNTIITQPYPTQLVPGACSARAMPYYIDHVPKAAIKSHHNVTYNNSILGVIASVQKAKLNNAKPLYVLFVRPYT